jgi:flagellar protein FlaG
VNFSVDSSTGKDVVRVFNSNTGELVRQLPNDEMLNFVKNLENMMGLIFDNKS